MESPFSKICRAKMHWATMAILLATPAVWSQTASEPQSDFGLLGQLSSQITVANSKNVAPVACAPTSTANGLTFLDNFYGPSLFTSSPNDYTAVNALATAMGTTYNGTKGGTPVAGMVTGLQSYLSPTGANPAPDVSVQSANFSSGTAAKDASSLAGVLEANDGVELLIQWGTFSAGTFKSSGGHAVTLDAVNYNPTMGFGTVGFVDPWGAGLPITASPSASFVTADVIALNGYLYITNYSENFIPPPENEGDEGAGDFAGNTAVTGVIYGYVAEGVPDVESTWLMLGVCAAGLATARRSLCGQKKPTRRLSMMGSEVCRC
jgi:hypothetical protein